MSRSVPIFATTARPPELVGIDDQQFGACGQIAAEQILDAGQGAGPPPLSEPLSDSEMQVLRYLPTNLTRPDIAGELRVSLNTVSTHVRSLYQARRPQPTRGGGPRPRPGVARALRTTGSRRAARKQTGRPA